jgi:hypothetical protein
MSNNGMMMVVMIGGCACLCSVCAAALLLLWHLGYLDDFLDFGDTNDDTNNNNNSSNNSSNNNSNNNNSNNSSDNTGSTETNTTLEGVASNACKWVCPDGWYQMPQNVKATYKLCKDTRDNKQCGGRDLDTGGSLVCIADRKDGSGHVGWFRPSRLPPDTKPNELFHINSQEALEAFHKRGGVYGPRFSQQYTLGFSDDPLHDKDKTYTDAHMFKYRGSLQTSTSPQGKCPDINQGANQFN